MAEEPHPPSPTPLTPPHREEDRLGWIRLLRSRRVGPTTFRRLMAEHGTADAALAALPEIARAAGLDDYEPCPESVALAEMREARLAGATMLAMGSDAYPAALAEIAEAPPFLWAIGDATLLGRPMMALVGARNASSLGVRMARRLAEELGQAGYVCVSGLARGIDTAAHLGSLRTGTVAVMAGGADVVYPPENAALAQEIQDRGLRLSEQPMGLVPQARHFPARNRIVSGLARGVVVVEAAAKSGSLITARTALDQGREVFAVPGHPFDARAQGCNMLIRDGAVLIRDAADVIEALGPAIAGTESAVAAPARAEVAAPDAECVGGRRAPSTKDAGNGSEANPARRALRAAHALHMQILDRLGPSPLAEDQLRRDLRLTDDEFAPALISLELDGRIQRHAGGLLSRRG